MASLAGIQIGNFLPSIDWGSLFWLFILFLVLIVGTVIGGLVWLYLNNKKQYWMKIPISTSFQGKESLIENDTAKTYSVGNSSNVVIWLKRAKKFSAYPQFAFGKNTFLHSRTATGDLVNYEVEAVSEHLRLAKIRLTPAVLRAGWVHTNKLLRDAYIKKFDWEKWIGIASNLIIVVLLLVVVVFAGYKIADYASAVQGTSQNFLTASNTFLNASQTLSNAINYAKTLPQSSGLVSGG